MNDWIFTPYIIIYIAAMGISFILSIISHRIKPAKGARFFSFMMAAVGVWILAYILELFSTGFQFKIIMMKLEYTALAVSLYYWFLFVVTYTQFQHWLNRYTLISMAIIPLYFLFNIMIAPKSSSVYQSYTLEQIGKLMVLSQERKIGFFIWTSWAYITLSLGMVLLVFRMINLPSKQRKQVYFLIPVILVIIIPNFLYLTGHMPIAPYDPTPISLVVVGILFTISIIYYKFIEVMPVAHALVFKNMRSGVIIVDANNRVLEINPKAERIFKTKQSKVAGKSLSVLLPDVIQLPENSKASTEITTEISIGTPPQIFDVQINTHYNSKGSEEGKIILMVDITDYKTVINELDAYARTVAHDLKNPLNAIHGFTQLLKSETKDIVSQETYENLLALDYSSSQMNTIIDSLLLLSQVRKLDEVKLVEIDMQESLNESLDKLEILTNQYNAEIKLPRQIHAAWGFPAWVQEVWINYISNAIKYGGTSPVIEIKSEKKGGFVYYYVSDNGSGLCEQEQKVIFKEFDRLGRHQGKISGHGLGLSIVKRIINKLGGAVGVKSEEGKGCEFYFSLPAKLD